MLNLHFRSRSRNRNKSRRRPLLQRGAANPVLPQPLPNTRRKPWSTHLLPLPLRRSAADPEKLLHRSLRLRARTATNSTRTT